ncbi:RE1-silencing transcription factor A-like [Acipenser oxyrinchus oxyrinchus]|uniref:RE1-silencing transcription factor A-like n=1 Tax=Acipenser oxyrinchus oxyrinchus TaxID=40147 RepID=A0AAD8GKE7_ACIOX|nr:RE1-silencing transcription factor A-like [Acipenser oxyrinchus oxyrinchus]
MAAQIGHSIGASMFSSTIGMPLSEDMYGLNELPKTNLPAPQLVMLANVALTAEVGGCEYLNEDKQMAELKTVGNSLSDSEVDEEEDNDDDDDDDDDDDYEGVPEDESEPEMPAEIKKTAGSDKDSLTSSPQSCYSMIDLRGKEIFGCFDDKSKRSKPFRCKPCQFEADCEEEFVHHITVHSAKNFIVQENAGKSAHSKEPEDNSEDGENCKGPIRCDRCGYNTNRYDHYLAHLRHHNKAGDDQRVFRCTICSYTTVSEYHWKKHLRNHFPKKVYTCCQCSYFSDRKNNYIQHIRTHTGERPYRCIHCPYSSSQKTHLTRHMRTHSGEKPFKCDQCSYVASNQHEVTRHARQVHNGPKPLNCPHCEYKTADRSNYKKHVELHVNPRQFLCPVCDYAASKKCNLQYHIKSRHHGCNDITMDVSKVRLRTKKAEAENLFEGDLEEAKDWQTNSEEDQEKHSSMKTQKEEKKDEVQREKTASSSTMNQITTRSRKLRKENSKASNKRQNTSEKKTEKSEKLVVRSEKLAGKSEKLVVRSEKLAGKSEKLAGKSEKMAVRSEKLAGKSEKMAVRSEKLAGKSERLVVRSEKLAGKSEKPVVRSEKLAGKSEKLVVRSEKLAGKSEKMAVRSEKMAAKSEKIAIKYEKPVGKSEKIAQKSKKLARKSEKLMEKSEQLLGKSEKMAEKSEKTKTGKRKADVMDSAQMKEDVKCTSSIAERKKRKVTFKDINPQKRSGRKVNREKFKKCISEQKSSSKRKPPKNKLSKRTSSPSSVKLKKRNKKIKKQQLAGRNSTERKTEKVETNECMADDSHDLQNQNQLIAETELPVIREDNQTSKGEASVLDMELTEVHEDKITENISEHKNIIEPAEDHRCEEAKTAEESENETNEPKEAVESQCSPKQDESHKEIAVEPNGVAIESDSKTADPLEIPKVALELPSVTDKTPVESMDVEEDEGIHSHDGSDISDSVSEGSDDSGLNSGVGSASEVTGTVAKANPEETRQAQESYVCIFCDRMFAVEGEYRRHLNRHLVNVYYLETAAEEEDQ